MREVHAQDAATFDTEVAAHYAPAILRGVVGAWPAVAKGRESPESFDAYLRRFASREPVDALTMPSQAAGRIFYNDDFSGFNFTRDRTPIAQVSERVLRNAKFGNKPTVVAQSALISSCLPGFEHENVLPVLPATVAPRIWLGGMAVTPAHFDESHNVACVVAGRRRFTLFPPQQVANLYIGPIGNAPTGTPISLVDFAKPDDAKFPRFREAMAHAQVADLEPGDAIYIPPLWWHHVQSLERYNVLVNYWWKDAAVQDRSALDGLLHSLLSVGALPDEVRAAWAAMYAHFVFGDRQSAAGHIPEEKRGVLAPMSPELAEQVKGFLRGKLG